MADSPPSVAQAESIKTRLKRAIEQQERRKAREGAAVVPPPPRSPLGHLRGPGDKLRTGSGRNEALWKFYSGGDERKDDSASTEFDDARRDFEALGLLQTPSSPKKEEDPRIKSATTTKTTTTTATKTTTATTPVLRNAYRRCGHADRWSSSRPRRPPPSSSSVPTIRAIAHKPDLLRCEGKSPSWIEQVFGTREEDEEESVSNASDESFRSVLSREEERKKKKTGRSEEDLLRPGDYVDDLVRRHQVEGEEEVVSLRTARTWLDQVGSENLDDEKKVRVLEKLLKIRLDASLASCLVRQGTGRHRERRLPEVLSALIKRHNGLSLHQKTLHLPRALALTAKLFAKCLELDDTHGLAKAVMRMDFNEGCPILKDIVSLCDSTRGRDLPLEVLSEMKGDAESRSLTSTVFHHAEEGVGESHALEALGATLDLSGSAAEAVRECPLLRKSLGIAAVQDFSDGGTMQSLETLWTKRFGQHVEKVELETGKKKCDSSAIRIMHLGPTLHCLAFVEDRGSPAEFLGRMAKDLERLTDRRNVNLEALKGPSTLVTVDAPAPVSALARGIVLEVDGQDHDCTARVYLLDYGHQVKLPFSRLAPLPMAAQETRPLIQFLRLQGISSLPEEEVWRCATRLLYKLFIPMEVRSQAVDAIHQLRGNLDLFTKPMLCSSDTYQQLIALQILHELNLKRWKLGAPLSDKPCDVELCRHLTRYLRDPSPLGVKDALYALFFVLDLMPRAVLYLAFENARVEEIMEEVFRRLKRDAENTDLMQLARKIKLMGSKGNAVISNQRVRQKQEMAFHSGIFRTQPHPRSHYYNRSRAEPPVQRPRSPLAPRRNFPPMSGRPQRHLMSMKDLRPEDCATVLTPKEEIRERTWSDPEDDQHCCEQRQQSKAVNRAEKLQAEMEAGRQRQTLERGMTLQVKNRRKVALLQANGRNELSIDKLASHVCAFLNSGEGGKICIGARPDGYIEGFQITRKQKDLFRQGFDRLLGGRFIHPRVLSDNLTLDFRALYDPRHPDPPYYLAEIQVGKTNGPANGYRVMEGAHRGKIFVRYKRETKELTHDLQRRLIIEAKVAEEEKKRQEEA